MGQVVAGVRAWQCSQPCPCVVGGFPRPCLFSTGIIVVPLVLKSIQYDVLKGSCSVGAHVRDAICYVLW